VLVKFDKEYAYGNTEDEFKKVALVASSQPELVVAEVPIQGFRALCIYLMLLLLLVSLSTCFTSISFVYVQKISTTEYFRVYNWTWIFFLYFNIVLTKLLIVSLYLWLSVSFLLASGYSRSVATCFLFFCRFLLKCHCTFVSVFNQIKQA